VTTYVLVHVFRYVGDIEVSIGVIGKLLELCIERLLWTISKSPLIEWLEITHPSKANFIAQVMKTADAVLSIFEVVVFYETKSGDQY